MHEPITMYKSPGFKPLYVIRTYASRILTSCLKPKTRLPEPACYNIIEAIMSEMKYRANREIPVRLKDYPSSFQIELDISFYGGCVILPAI